MSVDWKCEGEPSSAQSVRSDPQDRVGGRGTAGTFGIGGGTPIQECDKGENVCACGVVRSVTIRPRAGTPALEAELYDGSGRITLVWLGRRMIEGITPGRWLKVQGRLNLCNDEKTIFNPYYELKPVGDSAQ